MPPILCMKKLFRLLSVCFACWLCSCASTQRITVKQEQEGQTQETVIESNTKINSFSMIIFPPQAHLSPSRGAPSDRSERSGDKNKKGAPDKIDYNAPPSLSYVL